MVDASKQIEIQNAQAQIALLEQQKAMLTSRLMELPDDEASQRGVQTVLNDINTRIAGAKSALQKLVSPADLVKSKPSTETVTAPTTSQASPRETTEQPKETTQQTPSDNSTSKTSTVDKVVAAVGLVQQIPGADKIIDKAAEKMASAVDKFLEKYGNKKFQIVKSPKVSVNIPLGIPIVTLSASAQLTLSAELASSRSGANITSKATLAAVFNGKLGVAVGVKVLDQQVGVEGGLSVSANAIAKSVITLAISGTNLQGTMNPADIEITASAALYLKWSFGKPINWAINKLVDQFVLRSLKGSNRSGNQLNYPLGSIELLIVKTPVYSLTFNMAQGRFATDKSGSFTCQVHPKLKARLDAIRKSFRKQ